MVLLQQQLQLAHAQGNGGKQPSRWELCVSAEPMDIEWELSHGHGGSNEFSWHLCHLCRGEFFGLFSSALSDLREVCRQGDTWWVGVLAFSLMRHSHGEDPSPLWDEPSNPGSSYLMRSVSLDNWALRTHVEISRQVCNRSLKMVRDQSAVKCSDQISLWPQSQRSSRILGTPQPWASCLQHTFKL